jgi:hypothetical protein
VSNEKRSAIVAKLTAHGFVSAIMSSQAPMLKNARDFHVRVGTYTEHRSPLVALQLAKCRIIPRAANAINQKGFPSETSGRILNLVMLSVGDLGLRDGAKYHEICTWAHQIGFELCPAEVGPAFRVLYQHQAKGEVVRAAMKALPFIERGYGAGIFVIGCDEKGLFLDIDETRVDDFYESHNLFVFVRPRKLLTARSF